MSIAIEANFDGLIGPTHNYAGLSLGNVASMGNKKQISSPKQAALQGLLKMKSLMDMGFVQGVLAPQHRPDLSTIRDLGFNGQSDSEVLQDISKKAPNLLATLCSASSMWAANSATVSPSSDTEDKKVHITPANLVNKFHRFIEAPTTSRILRATFREDRYFIHHKPLPAHEVFGDEGAANHTRFCREYGDEGLELFVYGRHADADKGVGPKRFPARQTREASEAIARLHKLDPSRTVLAQQNPEVIDRGVFHNDVIAVGNRNCLFYHEHAFLDKEGLLQELQKKFLPFGELVFIEVPEKDVSIEEAVNSYLFNSQLLSTKDKMILLVPEESRSEVRVWEFLQGLISKSDQPIREVLVKDVKQSMRNGGGPACLRLRVVLTSEELAGVNPNTILTPKLYETLVAWVGKHYRDELSEGDLADPQLLLESQVALDELTQILSLGSVYPFQRSFT